MGGEPRRGGASGQRDGVQHGAGWGAVEHAGEGAQWRGDHARAGAGPGVRHHHRSRSDRQQQPHLHPGGSGQRCDLEAAGRLSARREEHQGDEGAVQPGDHVHAAPLRSVQRVGQEDQAPRKPPTPHLEGRHLPGAQVHAHGRGVDAPQRDQPGGENEKAARPRAVPERRSAGAHVQEARRRAQHRGSDGQKAREQSQEGARGRYARAHQRGAGSCDRDAQTQGQGSDRVAQPGVSAVLGDEAAALGLRAAQHRGREAGGHAAPARARAGLRGGLQLLRADPAVRRAAEGLPAGAVRERLRQDPLDVQQRPAVGGLCAAGHGAGRARCEEAEQGPMAYRKGLPVANRQDCDRVHDAAGAKGHPHRPERRCGSVGGGRELRGGGDAGADAAARPARLQRGLQLPATHVRAEPRDAQVGVRCGGRRGARGPGAQVSDVPRVAAEDGGRGQAIPHSLEQRQRPDGPPEATAQDQPAKDGAPDHARTRRVPAISSVPGLYGDARAVHRPHTHLRPRHLWDQAALRRKVSRRSHSDDALGRADGNRRERGARDCHTPHARLQGVCEEGEGGAACSGKDRDAADPPSQRHERGSPSSALLREEASAGVQRVKVLGSVGGARVRCVGWLKLETQKQSRFPFFASPCLAPRPSPHTFFSPSSPAAYPSSFCIVGVSLSTTGLVGMRR
mmetsp:Transcript_9175/g.21696  ORF Transcript_9175/g.21696 Transcript_9175/m.21696 type:complete len:679 (-) Transcript_9175:92-2128(-)